ncbi:STAS domain-containing protein [Terriglobus albidus]|uniref:STAS domain-containing protein n=1 Tax=Terriglobus albidus TaxID=1592106 RepID=UPI0037D9A849
MRIEHQASHSVRFSIQRREDSASGVVIFQLSGPLTIRHMYGSISPVALDHILESTPSNTECGVHIFDLRQVPYMDFAGLSLIAHHCQECRCRGIHTIVTGVGQRVLNRFKASRMENVLPMTLAH